MAGVLVSQTDKRQNMKELAQPCSDDKISVVIFTPKQIRQAFQTSLYSLSVLVLTGTERCGVLCILRFCFATIVVKSSCLCYHSLPAWPFSHLSHQQGVTTHRTAQHWIFFPLFHAILYKLSRLL